MKKIIGLFILFTVMACSPATEQSNTDTQTSESKETEVQQVQLGEVSINLPHINGMTESYSHPVVKALADKFNFDDAKILAYYLNNETYKQVDKLGSFEFDDFFQISTPKLFQYSKVNQFQFDQAAIMTESVLTSENQDNLKKVIDKKLDNIEVDLSIGIPILIESYSSNDNIKTYISLVKYQQANNEKVLITNINMMLIKDRLIYVYYYKDYQGKESIKTAKAKNDDIVLQLINANK